MRVAASEKNAMRRDQIARLEVSGSVKERRRIEVSNPAVQWYLGAIAALFGRYFTFAAPGASLGQGRAYLLDHARLRNG
jgi:hypothetical protein